jgi:predicted nucleic acid-binding protein
VVELADTSAWIASSRKPRLREAFDDALSANEIATCDAVKLELLYGTRNAEEFSSVRTRLDLLRQCPIGPDEWRRALDVYEVLAHQGGLHHRRVKHTDLLVAAAAESAGVGLVHYDEDFDVIALITKQRVRWIARRGSL